MKTYQQLELEVLELQIKLAESNIAFYSLARETFMPKLEAKRAEVAAEEKPNA